MSASPIGWDTASVCWELKQGNSGQRRVALTVTKPDGTALDSYAGWTGQIVLVRSPSTVPVLQIAPTVTGDARTMRIIVDIDFATAITRDIAAGTLIGDLLVLDPDSERHYALNITLKIDRSFAPVTP